MKLIRLRRRLSYANVMATVALFFALTGGAMAGAKYLFPADTIPATSDLAGSTYGIPQIAAGKITSGKIADGAITTSKFDDSALAPNTDKLDGMDSQSFAREVIEVTRNEVVALPTGSLGIDPGVDVVQHALGPGSYLALYKGEVELPGDGGVLCATAGIQEEVDFGRVDASSAVPTHSPIVMTNAFVVPPNTSAQFRINCVGSPGAKISTSRLEILRVGGVSS
jgi:hypothetical protein